MMRTLCLLFFIIFGINVSSTSLSAEDSISDSLAIEVEILQIKFGRLYLSKGTESLILPGCQFTFNCGTEVVNGIIEQSFEGVAISQPMPVLDERPLIDHNKCTMLIIPARIELHSSIRIGTDIPKESPLPQIMKECDTIEYRTMKFYDSRTVMLIDYSDGKLDGYISYRSAHIGASNNNVTSIPAPFMAILSPNPSREFNQYGKLTTSLYYNFDDNNIASLFDGDNPLSRNTVLLHESNSRRAYPFENGKGISLFRSFHKRIRKLKIFVQDNSLRPLADYYADLLSRERCRVSITNNKTKSDISLSWYKSSQSMAAILAADTTKEMRLNESISLLDNLVKSAESEKDSVRQQYMYSRAERVLVHDIGLFPLFSPTIYLTTAKNISGNIFDGDGNIRICQLGRIVIDSIETTR